MAGLIALFSRGAGAVDRELLAPSIDLVNTARHESVPLTEGMIVAAAHASAPLRGSRVKRDARFTGAFAGDLIGAAEIPWDELLSEDPGRSCQSLSGAFAVVVHDRQRNCLTVLTDRRGQHPLFYRSYNGGLLVSTSLVTFCRHDPGASQIDRRWLYEYLFFNFPVSEATFLAGVSRVPGGVALKFDLENGTMHAMSYVPRLEASEHLLVRPESFERAVTVFRERFPLHFEGASEAACALTGGWDARTVLAFAPEGRHVEAYTYGVRDCGDLAGAERLASELSIAHRTIHFDDSFVADLPRHMQQAIYLSPTMPKVRRSTLPYVYASLTDGGRRFPLVLSGIALGQLFRGHSASPPLTSPDMARIFRTGRPDFDREWWSTVFDSMTIEFEQHIEGCLERLRRDFGPFDSGSHHLLFMLYQVNPRYFTGEMEIASNYTTMRVPAWDLPVVELSLSIRESALSFSEFTGHERGAIEEMMLQSYVLTQVAPRFARVRVGEKRPDVILKGRLAHQGYRLYRAAGRLLSQTLKGTARRHAPLEDWDRWLNVVHRPFVDEVLFDGGSLIRDHVGDGILSEIERSRNGYWLGKLLSAEMVLRLVRRGWMA